MKRGLILAAVVSLGFVGYVSQQVFANRWSDDHYSIQTINDTRFHSHALSKNVQLMVKLVQDKAKGQPFEAQVAVASVVLNRVKSPNFPNAVDSVISQLDKSILSTKDKGNLSGEALKAVYDALNGWDPSHGALYFYAGNERHPELDRIVRINDIVFYK